MSNTSSVEVERPSIRLWLEKAGYGYHISTLFDADVLKSIRRDPGVEYAEEHVNQGIELGDLEDDTLLSSSDDETEAPGS